MVFNRKIAQEECENKKTLADAGEGEAPEGAKEQVGQAATRLWLGLAMATKFLISASIQE